MDTGYCSHGFIKTTRFNTYVPGSSSFLLGITRILSFSLLLLNDWRNRYILKRKEQNSFQVAKWLVLPSYFACIYAFMLVDFASGLCDILLSSTLADNNQRSSINNWLLPIESGLFHWILEGLAFFLMSYGAGQQGFRYALRFGLVWGIFTSVVIFFELYSLRLSQNINNSNSQKIQDINLAYSMFMIYNGILLIFYLSLVSLPQNVLYKRPSMKYYAIFNLVLQVYWMTTISVVRFYRETSICGLSVLGLLFEAFGQPVIIWWTLQRDSQYWQGLLPDADNPLAAVWDQIDISTATSISEVLGYYERDRKRPLTLLHFGLINLDQKLGFIAGGFSRVYFGHLKNQKVALKVMFAMELTSDDVIEFFNEAKILRTLAHENVVKLIGVCVMPPAVAIVLEFCYYGSLFDFIHKASNKKSQDSNVTGKTGATSNSSSQNSSFSSSEGREMIQKRLVGTMNPLRDSRNSEKSWGISVSNTEDDIHNANWNSYEGSDRTSGSSGLRDSVSSARSCNSASDTRQSEYFNVNIDQSIELVTAPKTKINDLKLNNVHDYSDNHLSGDILRNSKSTTDDTRVSYPSKENDSPKFKPVEISVKKNFPNDSSHDIFKEKVRLPTVPSAISISENSSDTFSRTISWKSANDIRDTVSSTDGNVRSGHLNSVDSSSSKYSDSSNSSQINSIKKDKISISASAAAKLKNLIKAGVSFSKLGFLNNSADAVEAGLPPAFYVSYLIRHQMLLDCIRAIDFIHSQNYMHCDIKSLNFLVTEVILIEILTFYLKYLFL